MKTLRDAQVGSTVTVKKLHGEGAVKRRIMDMGITKGVEIYVRKVAPLGDPMELNIRNYELSIRKADAEMIEVEEPADAAVEEPAEEGNSPGSSVLGVQQTRILEWVAMSSSRGSPQCRDRTQVSHIAGGFFTV